MPAKKGSIDGYNLKQKASDSIRYIGNNFWKVLPFGSLVNYRNNIGKISEKYNNKTGLIYIPNTKERFKGGLNELYAWAGATYIFVGLVIGAWNPLKYRDIPEKIIDGEAERREYKEQINSSYNKLLENAIDFKDSLEIYKKYGLPIKLLEPSFEQKEEMVKKNKLEKGVK